MSENEIKFLVPGTLQTNIPIKATQTRLYFEILLLNLPVGSVFSLGLSPSSTSYSQEASDYIVSIELPSGLARIMGMSAEWFPEAHFSSGDVIGCLVTTVPTCEINFSKNGVMGEPVPFSVYGSLLYPTILSTGPCRIQFNFGQCEYLYDPFSRRSFSSDPPSISPVLENPPAYVKELDVNPTASSSQNTH